MVGAEPDVAGYSLDTNYVSRTSIPLKSFSVFRLNPSDPCINSAQNYFDKSLLIQIDVIPYPGPTPDIQISCFLRIGRLKSAKGNQRAYTKSPRAPFPQVHYWSPFWHVWHSVKSVVNVLGLPMRPAVNCLLPRGDMLQENKLVQIRHASSEVHVPSCLIFFSSFRRPSEFCKFLNGRI